MVSLPKKLLVLELGQMDYQQARSIQLMLQSKRQRGLLPDLLVLAEHPPTITIGRDGGLSYILASKEQLQQKGITVFEVERGGSVTYHGPGQLMAYPILDLAQRHRDIHLYIQQLEQVIINLLRHYGIDAGRKDGLRGVWVGSSKITAIGVAVSRWITMHGLALNIQPDLSHFQLIVPCGLVGLGVTSLAKELEQHSQAVPNYQEVQKLFQEEFCRVFAYRPEPVSLSELQVENENASYTRSIC